MQPVPAVTPAGFTTPPPGRGLSRYQHQRLRWKACKKNEQCATVLVPLDYGQPDGTAITLAMAKKPATAHKKLGTLFIDPGGPGASGISFVSYFQAKGLGGYDIVGWDPRGVGQSTPVSCAGFDLDAYTSMDVSPDNAGEQQDLLEANRQLGLACLRKSGTLLQHISTFEVARDLDLLRGLVGDAQANLYGASYGTQIGATYAQLFPRHVGRLVLDGAVNITDNTSVSQAQGFERALDGFANWCAKRKCQLGASQAAVLKTIASFWRQMDGQPLAAGNRRLTQQLAVTGVTYLLYFPPKVYPYVLQAVQKAVVDHDGRYLLAWADQSNERSPRGSYGQINVAFPSIRCLDAPDHGVQGEIRLAQQANRKAPTLGPVLGPDLVCAEWPVKAVPQVKLVGRGAAPILVIGTTGDPATPYDYAVWMAKQLQSGVLVSYRGFGHTAYGQSPCVEKVVLAYFNHHKVPRDGTTC